MMRRADPTSGAKRAIPFIQSLFWVWMVSLLPGVSFAQQDPRDYDPTSAQWNGLGELISQAEALQIRLIPKDTLDYGALDPARPMMIIHPLTPLNEDYIEQFISRGGRALIADDFGATGDLFPRFQIQRLLDRPLSLTQQRAISGNPSLPLLEAAGRHPLLDGGVKVIAANRPAYLLSALPAVLYFDDRTHGLVFDLTVGEGKLIVVGDSSIFIKLMLGAADNLRFAQNAMRYLCQSINPCEIDLYTRAFPQLGEPSKPPPPETPGQTAKRSALEKLNSVNDALSALEQMVLERKLMRALIMVLTAGLGLFFISLLPGRSPRFLEIRFKPARASQPRSDFERHLDNFSRSQHPNHTLPLAILREEFEALFWPALYGELGPATAHERYSPERVQEAARRYAERVPSGQGASAQAVVFFLTQLARLPIRNQLLNTDVAQRARWSEHQLVQIYQQAQQILTPLTAQHASQHASSS